MYSVSVTSAALSLPACSIDELWRGQLAQELTPYHALQAERKQLETQLADLAAHDERIQLLAAIPGVGRVMAEIIAIHLDRPERFANARQLSSYAGLVPRRYQSGLRMGKGASLAAACG